MNYIKKLFSYESYFDLSRIRKTVKLVAFNISPGELKGYEWLIDYLNERKIDFIEDDKSISFKDSINNQLYSFHLKKISSDSLVFKQINVEEEYRTVVKEVLDRSLECKTVIDAGANIGLTTLYLTAFFPDARFFLLEPNTGTCNRLRKNLELNEVKNAVVLEKGLWNKKTHLSAKKGFRDGLDWAFSLEETSNPGSATIEVVSIPDLMEEYEIDTIDLLKIDIEGGESVVFGKNQDLGWLRKVRVLTIEIHDEKSEESTIKDILTYYGFSIQESGEIIIASNTSY